MTDLAALRAEIITVLGENLGTYTFSEGQTTPAIGIDDGSDPFVEQPSRTGLEVSIQPDQDLELEPMLAGDKRLNALRIQLKLGHRMRHANALDHFVFQNLRIVTRKHRPQRRRCGIGTGAIRTDGMTGRTLRLRNITSISDEILARGLNSGALRRPPSAGGAARQG